MTSPYTEPGRHVADDGRIVYEWPPKGRFAALWERFGAVGFTDDEAHELLSLLLRWRDENSTLVAYTDPVSGEWVDVEIPDYGPTA